MAIATANTAPARDEYLALCTEFPLAPIRTKARLREAEKVMDRLAVLDEVRMTPAQADYLEVLTDLYAAGERRLFPDEVADVEATKMSGLDALRFLCEQHGMSGGELGRLLGNRSLGNAILRGDRQLSKANIRTLAGHFAVSGDLFLAE